MGWDSVPSKQEEARDLRPESRLGAEVLELNEVAGRDALDWGLPDSTLCNALCVPSSFEYSAKSVQLIIIASSAGLALMEVEIDAAEPPGRTSYFE